MKSEIILLEDYNENHPYKNLRMHAPREFFLRNKNLCLICTWTVFGLIGATKKNQKSGQKLLPCYNLRKLS